MSRNASNLDARRWMQTTCRPHGRRWCVADRWCSTQQRRWIRRRSPGYRVVELEPLARTKPMPVEVSVCRRVDALDVAQSQRVPRSFGSIGDNAETRLCFPVLCAGDSTIEWVTTTEYRQQVTHGEIGIDGHNDGGHNALKSRVHTSPKNSSNSTKWHWLVAIVPLRIIDTRWL
jgi:hypothetical protein